MFKNLVIRLVSHPTTKKRYLDLVFHIRQTDLAQRWAKLVKQDLHYGIREDERFECFYEDSRTEIDTKINRVISLIEKLKSLHPEINFGTLDFTDIQSEVNRIHVNFADRHLVKKDLTKESFQYWSDLNVVLHEIEFCIYHMRHKGHKKNILNGFFTVTFHNKEIQNLTENDYENAVLNTTFGCIYLKYSQVGRHITELYRSQDEEIPLEHVQLFEKFSSDFFVYLGESQSHIYHLNLLDKIKKWFYEKEERFSQLGLSWNPKRLCIGHLPVAYLEEMCYSIPEIKALHRKVSHFQKVESVEII